VFSDFEISGDEEVVTYFKVQFWILPGGTDEKDRKP
jgi:hypothetical protein